MPYTPHGIGRHAGVKGRAPFEITEDVLNRVHRAGKLGLNKGQTAQYLGVSAETIRIHSMQHPELWATWEQGRMEGVMETAGSLYRNANEMAIDGKTGKPTGTPGGDFKAQQLYLKHVAGWRDGEEAQGGPVSVAVQIILPDNGRKALEADQRERIGSGDDPQD